MKEFLLDLFFPKFCLGCQKEGTYLCQDCQALIDISDRVFRGAKELSALYFATDYENFLIKRLITNFKYKPFAKDLAKTLTSLIIIYFQNLESPPKFLEKKEDFVFIPIPLSKSRLRWRGFNQAEEIARQLSRFFEIPLLSDTLVKIKNTVPQLNLTQEERKENIKGAFLCAKPQTARNKKVLLVDDIFTTGATMEEAALVLKKAGAKEIQGIVVARG